jgi:two-component system sensor histidine kinase RegB
LLGKHKPEFTIICTKNKIISTNDLLQYALINLINNANESATRSPEIIFDSNETFLIIRIINTCELSDDQITERWGKPKISRKQTGLGIGSFLANSTIEKQGGFVKMEVKHGQHPDTNEKNIVVEVNFPLILESSDSKTF